eukprot:scaffold3.g6356.t1
MGRLLAVVLALTGCLVSAAAQQKVLVLLDSLELEQSHSRFLEGLRGRGYDLELWAINDKKLQLKSWDDWLYDKLAILGSRKELGGAVDVAQVLEFADAGRDVLLAVDSHVSEELRELAQELGVDLDAFGTAVIDHFGYEAALGAEDHAAVLAAGATPSAAVLREPLPGPVLFRGIGMSVSPESETAFLALWGSPTAYGSKPGTAVTEVNLAGKELGLVALVQARNNARAAIIGSLDMLSDAYLGASAATCDGQSVGTLGNEALATAVSEWAFHERGVLRASHMRHHPVGSEAQLDIYRINEEVGAFESVEAVVFSVEIQELADGAWRPYRTDDVQVELVMLDPYVRATLAHDGAGTFSTAIRLPDVYGVFKWVLEYRRPGYSRIELEEQVPIRPYKHNEYERFITQARAGGARHGGGMGAFPYYASIAAMMAGFFVTGLAFLYTK